jgi:hypothetical protein
VAHVWPSWAQDDHIPRNSGRGEPAAGTTGLHLTEEAARRSRSMSQYHGMLKIRTRPMRTDQLRRSGLWMTICLTQSKVVVNSYCITVSPPGGTDDRFVRSSAFVDSSSCPWRSACLGTWRWAGVTLQSSEHLARRRATSVQRVRSQVLRVADASPRTSDRGAIRPNPRGSSTYPQSLARLPYRRAGGVGLRPNPVASLRPTDADA